MEDIKIVNKIKSGPYWRVNLRPYEFNEEKIKTLSEIRKLLDQCQVSLRGWDFPHIDHQKTMNGQDWVQSECDFNDIIEFWRFFKSGQFIHYFSVYEHYIKSQKVNPSSMWETRNDGQPSGYVGIITTIYRMTEIYEFVMRLAQKDVYDKGISISITLSGINNFKLFYFEAERVLFRSYISKVNEIKLESRLSIEELLAKGHDEAIKKCIQVFEIFNWMDCPYNIFVEDQKKFLERRI